MKVYVVACTDIPGNYKTVSQEAYSTLEKAQKNPAKKLKGE
jgi:hypothetical protein